jgi:membrane protein YqaA with SNARE-associated domain
MKKWLLVHIKKLHRYASEPWYPFFLGLIGALMHFVLILPLDTLFISSTLIAGNRWLKNAIATTIGFTIGGTACALMVQTYGLELVERIAPGIVKTAIWARADHWIHHYGVVAIGLFSEIPLALHPLVALAGINHMPLLAVALSLFIGRIIKYCLLGWFCAYLPAKLPLPKDVEDLIRAEPKTDAE